MKTNIFNKVKGLVKTSPFYLFTLLPLFTACSPESFDGANGSQPSISDYEDCFNVSVDQSTNTATFTFTGAKGVTPYWIVDGDTENATRSGAFSFTKYWRKKGEHKVECRVLGKNGMSDGSITKTFSIEKTKMNGFGGFDTENNNLLKDAKLNDFSTWFANAGWSAFDVQPTPKYNNGEVSIHWNEVGPDRWQGQFALNNLGISTLSKSKKYDFSCIVTSTKTHGGFKIKICQQDNDDNILMDKDFKITEAGEPKCFYATELEGIEAGDIKIVFDFGGGQEDTEVLIENLVLVDHDLNTIEAPQELAAEFNYNDPKNLWKQIDDEQAFEEGCWYGDAGWGDMGISVADLKSVHQGAKHTITIPATTVNEQWHAQYSLNLTKGIEIPFAGTDKIDFSCHVSTTEKLPGATFKLTQADNDDNYFFADRVEIKKGEWVVRYENIPLSKAEDAANIKFVFDFAGAEAGTEITISNITIFKK
jgi:hypothetical protein